MKVIPIAATQVFYDALELHTDYTPHETERDADELAEFAGRNCYQSWNRPNPETATNHGYLSNILTQGHFSVLEHSSVSFYVTGISRALLTELERHRFLSFSVISQRYVDAKDINVTVPPIINELPDAAKAKATTYLVNAYVESMDMYNALVKLFTDNGYKRKQAREAARAVLPNLMDTPMVVTGNLRAWRDIIAKRFHKAADKEIAQFAAQVLGHLRIIAPNSVQDIPEVMYG